MGEWMMAYVEKKDDEPIPNESPDGVRERRCWGAMDRKGICNNTVRSVVRVYCDECRDYFDSGGWKKWS